MQSTGDQSIQFELASLNQALQLLEQRTQDLRTAEVVAMQSIPMIKTMEFTNMNLVRKINSAFIITLPVFKQALAQAIMLKQQKMYLYFVSNPDSPYYQSETFGEVLNFMTQNVRRCNLREANGKRSMVVSDIPSVGAALSICRSILSD